MAGNSGPYRVGALIEAGWLASASDNKLAQANHQNTQCSRLVAKEALAVGRYAPGGA